MTDTNSPEKKKRKSFNELFENDRFVVVVSLLLAFICWFAVSYANPEGTKTINVEIDIDIAGKVPDLLGYQVFSSEIYTVSVTISGSKFRISDSQFDKSEISATVDVSQVNSVGERNVPVIVSLSSSAIKDGVNIEDYFVMGSNSKNINLYFDEFKTKEFTLLPEITHLHEGLVPEGYEYEEPFASYRQIEISGPSLQINKINEVVARVNFDRVLSEVTTENAVIAYNTKDGTEPRYVEYALLPEVSEPLTVTIPVRKVVVLPLTVDFTNVPTAYSENQNPISYTISPEELTVAIAPDSLEGGIDTLVVSTIDFRDLNNTKQVFDYPISQLGVSVKDDIETIRVTVDARSTQSFDISSTTLDLTLDNNYTFKNNDNIDRIVMMSSKIENITICGPQARLDQISEEDISVSINLADVTLSTGVNTVSARISVNDVNDCWVYGVYKVRINYIG